MSEKIQKTFSLIRTEGIGVTFRYCLSYLQYRFLGKRLLAVEDILYQRWREKHSLSSEQLQAMREESAAFPYKPLISILMPVYNVDPHLLRKAVKSVERQAYPNWELCIADDCSTTPETKSELDRIAKRNQKVKVRFLEENQGIAGASNAALELADGEFVALLDNDDELAPEALFEVAKLLNEHKDADFIYSDEDKLDEQGRHIEAFLKPDWSPELLLSTMYTSHLGVYRKNLIDEIGGFCTGFDGAQDFDLVLRLTERTKRIHHIAKILYHWRRTGGSTSIAYQSMSGGKAATGSSLTALSNALQRRDIKGIVEQGKFNGSYRIRPTYHSDLQVSIIIPTRERGEHLRKCIDSFTRLTKRPRYEIIIADNDSKEAFTRQYMDSLAREGRARIVSFPGEFNFSSINNEAAAQANGDALLFLNNDTEVIDGGWLEAMLELLLLPDVGVVGAKLLYPDDTVQHAGVVLWHCGTAAHVHSRLPRDEHGYFGMADTIRNCSAVSAACMMVKRTLFNELSGFDSQFAVSYQDVDFCLRAAKAGYRTVYTPFAMLYHHESVSTGKRSNEQEEHLFIDRWKSVFPSDPFYNRNFPPTRADFRLDCS